jgi:hypothetical protein
VHSILADLPHYSVAASDTAKRVWDGERADDEDPIALEIIKGLASVHLAA